MVDPTLLPQATTAQTPKTTEYGALNVPAIAAGGSYLDPTTGVKIYRLTSATFPTASANWGHDYSEGGDEISLPHTGSTRTIKVNAWGAAGHWLIDFNPTTGVSNPRALSGTMDPSHDLSFTFSSNPSTPQYAFIGNGTGVRRFDVRTMSAAPGDGWPVPNESGDCIWFHQSESDGLFVWMRGSSGGSGIVAYEPSSGTKHVQTDANANEPRIDRAGRYVAFTMDTPPNGLKVWDTQADTVSALWPSVGDPNYPFGHNASLRHRWIGVDWNGSFPDEYEKFVTDTFDAVSHFAGPSVGTLVYGNGNWVQHPADLDDQWAAFSHYSSLMPTGAAWLAPGGIVLLTANGQRRLLGHMYNTSTNYAFYSFPKFSPDGRYLMFTSNMNGSGRSDVFLAELPTR
jgi:hypothetical protein